MSHTACLTGSFSIEQNTGKLCSVGNSNRTLTNMYITFERTKCCDGKHVVPVKMCIHARGTRFLLDLHVQDVLGRYKFRTHQGRHVRVVDRAKHIREAMYAS